MFVIMLRSDSISLRSYLAPLGSMALSANFFVERFRASHGHFVVRMVLKNMSDHFSCDDLDNIIATACLFRVSVRFGWDGGYEYAMFI